LASLYGHTSHTVRINLHANQPTVSKLKMRHKEMPRPPHTKYGDFIIVQIYSLGRKIR